MLDYVYGNDEPVAHFVAQLIPSCRERGFPKSAKAMGVIDGEGHLIAGVVYHNYNPEAGIIEISVAALPGAKWLTRETLRQMFRYPFLQVGCQMIMMLIPADDERSLRICAAFGCMLIKIPRMLGRDRDGVLGLLTYEDWASNRFHQTEQLREAAE